MRTIFGLPEQQVVDATAQLGASGFGAFDLHEATTLFARAVWSRLVEPGDRVAGAFIAEVGASRALDIFLSTKDAEPEVVRKLVPNSIQNEFLRQHTLWKPRLDLRDTLKDLSVARQRNISLLTPDSPQWPERLNDLGQHAPLMLWIRGNYQLLAQRSLSVVGARAATGYGEHVTAEIVSHVGSRGVTVVSGGAYGVDGVAHRTSLAIASDTIAVLAGGVDRLYPSGHSALLSQIAEHGTLCAEQPPGSSPTKWRFLQRNRIIAAMSNATLVCEAGHRSGSLNTAGHAVELARPLGAVPGPVTSTASAGCHRLLRDYDAICVRNGDDALELIGSPSESASHAQTTQLSELCTRVRDAIPTRLASPVSDIARRAGVSNRETLDALIELELDGAVSQMGEGLWRLASHSTAAR